MNKWQIICPLMAALVAAIISSLFTSGFDHRRHYVQAQTRMIGMELIDASNSPRLANVGSNLQGELSQLLKTPAGLADVVLGDEPPPVGDGSACSRLILSNSAGMRLGIRLKQDRKPEMFHILGYWTIAEARTTP